MNGVTIHDETPADAEAIRALTEAAFRDAPHGSGTEAAIVDALRAAGALSLSLVARENGQITGHVAFSPVRIDTGEGQWFGLGPISVHADHRRRGIGAALVREGLSRLRQQGAAGVVLLGDPAWYGRFGFVSDGALRYGDIPVAYVQRVIFTGTPPKGEVRYHPAFDASGDGVTGP